MHLGDLLTLKEEERYTYFYTKESVSGIEDVFPIHQKDNPIMMLIDLKSFDGSLWCKVLIIDKMKMGYVQSRSVRRL